LKKLFSIVLSLALLVSLGVLATAPVAAVTQPSISPTSATFNLNAPAQVQTTIAWNAASDVISIEEAGVGLLTEGEASDWVHYGTLLVITPTYLAGVLTYIGDSVTLVITFDVGVCVLTITATGNGPSISPTSATWVWGSTSPVTTTINWGDAALLNIIIDPIIGPLVPAVDYDQLGLAPNPAVLVFYPAFLSLALTDIGDSTTVTLLFDTGSCTLTITAVGPNPTINPSSTTWVKGSTAVVTTTITWNSAATLTGINKAGGAALVTPGNYVVLGNLLVIKSAYLAANLVNVGDAIALVLTFDVGECVFTITASGALVPGVSPASVTYNIGSLANVTTSITWGNATNITGVVDVSSLSNIVPLVASTDYWVVNNTLTVRGSCSMSGWGGLECRLDASSRIARLLELTFNDVAGTKVILTVSSGGFTLPSLSSTALTFDLDRLNDPLYLYAVALITFGTATNISAVVVGSYPASIPTYPTAPTCNQTLAYGSYLTGKDYYTAYVGAYASYAILIWKSTFLAQACSNTSAGANLTKIGDKINLVLYWGPWNPVYIPAPNYYGFTQVGSCPINEFLYGYPYRYSPVGVTITAVGTSASIAPAKADFDLDDPASTNNTITWGPHATGVASIWNGATQLDPSDYSVEAYVNKDTPSDLIINASYLADELKQVDDQAVLTVKFDEGIDAKLTVTAIGTPLCFIATAAGADAPQLDILRAFRDEVLRPNAPWLVSLYYKVSPAIAKVIAGNEALKWLVKEAFVDPITCIVERVMD
jgi:hypothetical protein